MRLPLLALFAVSMALHAEEPAPKISDWNGYEKQDFEVAGHQALIVVPKTVANGKPWIWRTEFFGHEPQGDIALLGAGWHNRLLEDQRHVWRSRRDRLDGEIP